MGVTKIGNIVSRMGLVPTSLAFRGSVLPLHHIGSLISPLYPHPPVCVHLLASQVNAGYYTHLPAIVSLLMLERMS